MKKIAYTNIFEDVLFHKDFIYLGSEFDNPINFKEIISEPAVCTHAMIFTLEGAIKVRNLILLTL